MHVLQKVSSLLCFLGWVHFIEAKLKCEIIKNAKPSQYKLSPETIKATSRTNSSMYQVFDCTCPVDTSGREGYEEFGDSMKEELDRYYYNKDGLDWADSQLVRLSGCSRLVVSLGGNGNQALHMTLSQRRVALMFEDIKQLDLTSLEISHTPTESNKRDKITSIIFRWKYELRSFL